MRLIPPAPVMLLREVRTYLRGGRPRRSWAARWAAVPKRTRLAVLLAALILAGPWLLPAYLRYVNHAWETTWAASARSALVNWLAPKR